MGLHRRQNIRVDQVLGVIPTRYRDDDNINRGHQAFEVVDMFSRIGDAFDTAAKVFHVHREAVVTASRNRLADPPHPDDPDGFARQMHP